MILESLRLTQFRCYDELQLQFEPRFNTITGLNGQGKTSILEAIYLLASMKSFRLAKNSELIQLGKDQASICGKTGFGNIHTELTVRITPRSKTATINGKSCRFLSEYIGKLGAVTFSPQDLEIIRGGPEMRRSWIDRMAAIFAPEHLDLSVRFNKALQQRNRELRMLSQGKISALPDDFDVWTAEIERLGSEVIHNRVQTVDKVAENINRYYCSISGTSETVKIAYEMAENAPLGAGQENLVSVESISRFLRTNLQKLGPKEQILGTTLVGPHRDELHVTLNDHLLKAFGSQGEVRSTVLALRLSEVQAYVEQRGIDPVLLIDDFSSELDSQRRDFLLSYLENIKSQVFLTTTEELNLGKVFQVQEGKVSVNGY